MSREGKVPAGVKPRVVMFLNRMEIVLFHAILIVLFPVLVNAEANDFSQWLDALKKEALSRGISEATLDGALAGVRPLERVIELDRNQPEFKKDFKSYFNMMVNERRITKGKSMLLTHRTLLENIQKTYGIQPRYLIAIWGLETNFGQNLGGFPVIDSLVTLAYDARRSSFFRKELLHALKIIDEGHIKASKMQGSWAGAMGQLQFMPSTFSIFAVDEDKDGIKDIWHSLPDAFASAANYLRSFNWRSDMIWGREVKVPGDMSKGLSGLKTKKPLTEWQALGIRTMNGENLPAFDATASLIMPAGINGPAYLIYQNYRSIMRWNPSHFYALAVCTLADRIAGM